MKVCFINPPFKAEYGKFSRESRSPSIGHSGVLYYPLWLIYAACVAEKNGFDVAFIDAPAKQMNKEQTIERVKKEAADAKLFVFDTSTPSIYSDVEFAATIKKMYPNAFTMLVGTHPSATPVWQVEPCYNFDEIVPLYSEWDHTAGKNAADGLYAVRDGERWSLFSTKTGNIMMQDAAQQMPYLYGTNELSVWLDDEYYNYDNFVAMREKCEGLNAELQANGAEIEVLYDGVGGYANRWIYTEDGQIYYDLLGTYEFSGTPLAQVSDAPRHQGEETLLPAKLQQGQLCADAGRHGGRGAAARV